MFKSKKLWAYSTAAMIAATPMSAETQATQILEDYFSTVKSFPIEMQVGDKDEAGKYTQWNNITFQSTDGTLQIAVPWVRVEKKFLGGHVLTLAPKIDGAFQSPDAKILEPIKFVLESSGTKVNISGDSGEREFTSVFDSFNLRTVDSNIANLNFTVSGGQSSQTITSGDAARAAGTFSYDKLSLDYNLPIEGQEMNSQTVMNGMSGSFEFPIYKNITSKENPLEWFDLNRRIWLDYTIGPSTGTSTSVTPMGPIKIDMKYGSGTGAMGLVDSSIQLTGDSNDIDYTVQLPGMGLGPMNFSVKSGIVDMRFPFDNVENSKQAVYKIALSELLLSDDVWATFDPGKILPRDAINLDVDLEASLRWLQKLKDLEPGKAPETLPLQADSATIKAFNLDIAGASLNTKGDIVLDNSQFPPVPAGKVDISLSGARGLLEKLTQMGLVPAQNAMMINGMSGMFFRPGSNGEDHLVSEIELMKDGRITANGMPVK